MELPRLKKFGCTISTSNMWYLDHICMYQPSFFPFQMCNEVVLDPQFAKGENTRDIQRFRIPSRWDINYSPLFEEWGQHAQ